MTADKVWYCFNFRCHALVAVQGVEQRPQTIGNFNQVLVQLRHIPLTLTLESSSSNASVQPWRSSWVSNTSATSEYCVTMIPKNTFYFTCLSGTRRHMLFPKNTFYRTQVRSLGLTDSVTHSLTNSCLVNLIDLTLACEDNYSRPVDFEQKVWSRFEVEVQARF